MHACLIFPSAPRVRPWDPQGASRGHYTVFGSSPGHQGKPTKAPLELQDTPQADIDQDNVSVAGMLQGAVGRTVDTPVFACCWTIIRGFHTIAGGTEHTVGTRLDAVFPILQRLVDADFAAVEIGF